MTWRDLTRARRWGLLMLVSAGSSIIFYIPSLRRVFPDQMMDALGLNNEQVGILMAAYGITSMICYVPSGILADKVRMRTLSWVGYIATAVLLYVYALLPSFGVLMVLMIGLGVTTILIWWGTRLKLVRLLFDESEYPSRIGWSYLFFALGGLLVGNVIATLLLNHTGTDTAGHQAFLRYLLLSVATIILVMGVLAFLFIPRFDNEFDPNAKRLSLSEFVAALKNPAVVWASLTMLFSYFAYTSITYTTQWLQIGAIGVGAVMIANIGNVRSYGMGVFSGPIAGAITKRVGSTSKVVMGGFALAVVGLLTFVLLPWNTSMAVPFIVLTLALGFVCTGVFYVTTGQLTEARVPTQTFGAAAGIVSLVGFLPDTFRDIWFGRMIDQANLADGGNTGDAFRTIWWIVIAACVLGAFCAFMMLRVCARTGLPHRVEDDVDGRAVGDAFGVPHSPLDRQHVAALLVARED
ncbi:MFS transporter [Xylanimonas allomyrinae]|uniref:MFS transporter n=2 Tax=Xylanimonas allomyrinae TaxID=2509459 RepID=A0A4P6ENV1_9MICO|nr:MFS transporter [Xylanimonas allomyrinae]